MPDYNYNPSAISSSIEVFEKGSYEFIIGKPKAFLAKNDDQTPKNWGVRFPVQEAASQKRSVFNCYLHNDGSASMTKRFQMACLGFGKGKAEEEKFNNMPEIKNGDWRLDFDTGECGTAWSLFDGARAICDVEVGVNKNTGEEQQNWKSWRPIGK